MVEKWLSRLNQDPVPWLLQSNPWTIYRTLRDLQDVPADSPAAMKARADLIADSRVLKLVQEAADWMPRAPSRFSDPQISYFKLRLLADFGLEAGDPGIGDIIARAIAHTDGGMFAVHGNLPERRKKGEAPVKPDTYPDRWHVAPCNSPIITYSLLRLGYTDAVVGESVARMQEKWSDGQGWFCNFFFVEGQRKRLRVGCPMAGLMALDVFSLAPELKESQYSRNAFEPLLFHKDYGKSLYFFGRSKKFWTLKYPFVWYNALYMADVLSRFDFLKDSPVLQELITWIELSQDESGRFRPTSVFMPYKGWDFGNKKEPSPWITFLCCRILRRYYS